jgi:hypothetical protein
VNNHSRGEYWCLRCGSIGLMANHSQSVSSWRMTQAPFWSLESLIIVLATVFNGGTHRVSAFLGQS